jgi:two-component system, NarL family, nitrate/nitrite response regulator NarL
MPAIAQTPVVASAVQPRVILADDHPLLRDSLRRLLDEIGLKVVGEAIDGEQAVEYAYHLRPDLLILDLSMPKASGLDALFELSKHENSTKVLFLTADMNRDEILKAICLGARGVVLKISPPEVLVTAIRAVVAGKYWFDSRPLENIDAYRTQLVSTVSYPKQIEEKQFGLTPRELEVAAGILAAFSNKEIAQHLRIAENTVKKHITSVYNKTGCSTRVELAIFVQHHKLKLPPID